MKTHIPELDGVRAISILLVLATHMLPIGPKSLQLNAAAGLMGMSLFFCLSGFLITGFLYRSPDVSAFLVKRLARIVPLVALYAFIVGVLIHKDWDVFVASLLFTLNYSDPLLVPGIGHLWSICVEMHFYVLIASLCALLGRRAFWLVPLILVAVVGLRMFEGATVSIRTHLRMDEILVGSCLAILWANKDQKWMHRIQQILARGFLPALLLWFISCHGKGGDLMFLRSVFAMLVVGGILFMKEGSVRAFLRLATLRYIATISYALYIWHPLTMLGWLGEGDRWTLYLVKRPLSFLATFALANISTFTFEAWMNRLGRRALIKGSPEGAAS